MKLKDYLLPLTWWKSHEVRFSNVSFATWQTLGILESHIKIEWIFNIVGMLTRLLCYRLGVNNFNKLVIDMGTFTKIGPIRIITNALFFMFLCQNYINMEHFLIHFDDNVLNIL